MEFNLIIKLIEKNILKELKHFQKKCASFTEHIIHSSILDQKTDHPYGEKNSLHHTILLQQHKGIPV